MFLDLFRFLLGRTIGRVRGAWGEPALRVPENATLERLEQAAKDDPSALNFNDLGIFLQGAARFEEALAAFDRAIEIDPRFAAAYFNRGNAQSDLRRHSAALGSFERAIELNPGWADAIVGRGNELSELGRHESALESYERAIAIRPDFAGAHFNRAVALRELGRTEEALAGFERTLQIEPGHEYVYGMWLFNKMAVCDWRGIEADFARLDGMIERGEKAAPPFMVLVTPSSPALQKKAAEDWIRARHPPVRASPATATPPGQGRIRIGYFSADFHDHATSHLMAELFELHDRTKFELTAFSFGADRPDAIRMRIAAAFDRFIDVRGLADIEVATMAKRLGIDIALDLKGFSQESRPGIFALRAAPVQVNYLGYPGTMGAPYIDYLIADPTLVPESHRRFYSEKIACLPHSYQPNDRKRAVSDRIVTREEAGLPPAGFVFCCFNNNFKILPAMFDCWMRVLRAVDGSVLWLLGDNARAVANLRAQAAARRVDADRLIFAPRVPHAEHMARHRLADLFLDTLPCNAHTTASDALWAGVPVLTCMGETFAGRVAASLVNAIGLPELVAHDLASYEALAISLANDPGRLGEVKRALAVNRRESPLFDTALYARHLEAACTTMHERHRAGLPPEHFQVRPLARS